MTKASSGSGTLQRIFADAHCLARANYFFRKRFEEKFGPRRVVNLVISRGAEIRFLHARLLAAQIRNADRPNFLLLNRREKFHFAQRITRQIPGRRQASELRNKPSTSRSEETRSIPSADKSITVGILHYQPDARAGLGILKAAQLHHHFVRSQACYNGPFPDVSNQAC